MNRKDILRKSLIGLAGLVVLVAAGIKFYHHRHFKEPVVIGDQVRVKKLGDYFNGIKGTFNDCNVLKPFSFIRL